MRIMIEWQRLFSTLESTVEFIFVFLEIAYKGSFSKYISEIPLQQWQARLNSIESIKYNRTSEMS